MPLDTRDARAQATRGLAGTRLQYLWGKLPYFRCKHAEELP